MKGGWKGEAGRGRLEGGGWKGEAGRGGGRARGKREGGREVVGKKRTGEVSRRGRLRLSCRGTSSWRCMLRCPCPPPPRPHCHLPARTTRHPCLHRSQRGKGGERGKGRGETRMYE